MSLNAYAHPLLEQLNSQLDADVTRFSNDKYTKQKIIELIDSACDRSLSLVKERVKLAEKRVAKCNQKG